MNEGTIVNIPLDEIEPEIRSHINHAQAVVTAQNEKLAALGLVAAVTAKALTELVKYTSIRNNQTVRFQSYNTIAARLISSFWEDYGLIVLKRVNGNGQATVAAEIKTTSTPAPHRPARHIAAAQNKPRHSTKRIPDNIRDKVRKIAAEKPVGVSDFSWFSEIAHDTGIAYNTVWRIAKEQR